MLTMMSLWACALEGRGSASDGKDLFQPVGDEVWGDLVVHLPEAEYKAGAKVQVRMPGTGLVDVVIGEAMQVPLESCLVVTYTGTTPGSTELCALGLVENEETAIALAAVEVPIEPFETDLGLPALPVRLTPQGVVTGTGISNIGPLAEGVAFLVVPGTYKLSVADHQRELATNYDIATDAGPVSAATHYGETFEVAPGKRHVVEVAEDLRATIAVEAPERALPTASSPSSVFEFLTFTSRYANGARGVDPSLRVSTTDLRYFPVVNQDVSVSLNGTKQAIDLLAGETLDLPVQRIDVADVRVTGSDGSATSVTGTYVVARFDGTYWNTLEVKPSGSTTSYAVGGRTPSGVDLLPGELYRVTVTYTTNGGTKTLKGEFDFRER